MNLKAPRGYTGFCPIKCSDDSEQVSPSSFRVDSLSVAAAEEEQEEEGEEEAYAKFHYDGALSDAHRRQQLAGCS